MDVETLAADDWKILRDVRLRALEDSPTAYISSRQMEIAWTEERWRSSFEGSVWVVARGRQEIVGMARSVRVEYRPAFERHLESVWVEPGHRRTGVLRALLRYLAELEPGRPRMAGLGPDRQRGRADGVRAAGVPVDRGAPAAERLNRTQRGAT